MSGGAEAEFGSTLLSAPASFNGRRVYILPFDYYPNLDETNPEPTAVAQKLNPNALPMMLAALSPLLPLRGVPAGAARAT